MTRNGTKSGIVEVFFYLLTASLYTIAVYNDHIIFVERRFAKAGLNTHTSFGGRAKFLTLIDMWIQFTYFVLCLVNAIIELLFDGKSKNNHQPRFLRKVASFIYTRLAFPAGVIVSLSFWGLFFIDRDLIYSKKMEEIIPNYQNHLIHTLPLFSAVLDSFVTKHNYNKSFFKGFLPTALFSILYVIWIYVIAFYGGFWVYPVLRVLSTQNRIIFIFGLLLLTAFVYKAGETLNTLIWSNSPSANVKLVKSSPAPSGAKARLAKKSN